MKKQFKAVHIGNHRHFVLTFEEGKKVIAFDTDKNVIKKLTEKTISRWYEIGDEIKPKKKGPITRDSRKKLTIEQVEEIRGKHSKGYSIKSLADEYGMSYSGMYWVCKKATWTDMEKEREQEKRFKKALEENEA